MFSNAGRSTIKPHSMVRSRAADRPRRGGLRLRPADPRGCDSLAEGERHRWAAAACGTLPRLPCSWWSHVTTCQLGRRGLAGRGCRALCAGLGDPGLPGSAQRPAWAGLRPTRLPVPPGHLPGWSRPGVQVGLPGGQMGACCLPVGEPSLAAELPAVGTLSVELAEGTSWKGAEVRWPGPWPRGRTGPPPGSPPPQPGVPNHPHPGRSLPALSQPPKRRWPWILPHRVAWRWGRPWAGHPLASECQSHPALPGRSPVLSHVEEEQRARGLPRPGSYDLMGPRLVSRDKPSSPQP